MAGKNNVKKGFAIYLLILFLAIVATFLVIIIISLFSPFRDVLGFKYFAYRDKTYEYHVTGGSEDEVFDFQNLKKINVNCNFADVKIERYYQIDKNALCFENVSSGFARSDQDVRFTYEVYYSGQNLDELNITVHEPEGFLFLSKNISISILCPVRDSSKNFIDSSLENTTIDIINTSGSVMIGNNTKPYDALGEQGCYINVGDLRVKKTGGRVQFNNYAGNGFGDVFIKTESGSISASRSITVNNSLKIYSKSADINLSGINYKGSTPAILDIENSKFYAGKFAGNINLTIVNGYFDMDVLEGTLISDNSETRMAKATIYIKDMKGHVSLPFAYNSRIDFDKIESGSQLQVSGTGNNVEIKELYGAAWIETTSGNVSVHTYADDISIKTTTGRINLTFDSSTLADGIELSSTSGDIDLKVKDNLAFFLYVWDVAGNMRNDDRIKINWLKNDFQLPHQFHSGTKVLEIRTDARVNISLI